jgi:CelD/BcsL family acetyltransferase involved in cellulose biosynthesis
MFARNIHLAVDLEGRAPSMPFALSEVTFDVLHSPTLVEAEWRSLEALPRNSLNQSFDWCTAWWRTKGLSPLILRGQIAGRIVMLMPLQVTSRFGLRTARFPGQRFNNINTGIFSWDFPHLSGRDLASFTHSIRTCLKKHADILVLDGLPDVWNGSKNPFVALATSENPNPSFQLPLRSSMEETIAQLHAKTRRKRHRSQCRRLDAIGGFSHYCPVEAHEQHVLLDLFFQQKAERFAAFGLPNVFHPPEVQEFFHSLIDRSVGERDYMLRMHALRLHGNNEGTMVAISGLSRKGGHLLCQFGSIDDKLCPDASPGELLFWLMIEQACQEGGSVFDFGVGDQPYKHSWCPQRTLTQDVMLAITPKGGTAMPILQRFARLRLAIKGDRRLYAAVQRVRAAVRI